MNRAGTDRRYKASFQPSAGVDAADSQTSFIPFNQMSWDWSDGTGECSTKDPDGYQHKCCSAANPEVRQLPCRHLPCAGRRAHARP